MNIGIMFPLTLPDNDDSRLLDWARQADTGPFSSLGINDRVVYQNVDSLTMLASAAAVTNRIRLMTNVIVAPLRSASLLAKQSAMNCSSCQPLQDWTSFLALRDVL